MFESFRQALASFFESHIGSLINRILVHLGIGTITFTSAQQFFDNLVLQSAQYYGYLSFEVKQLLSLAGIPEALGMVLGALAIKFGLKFTPRYGFLGHNNQDQS